MKITPAIAGMLLAGGLLAMPVQAAGLLNGVLGGTGSVVGSVGNTVNGLLGGGGGGGANVPGVASVSTDSTGGSHVNASLLGGGGSTLNVGLQSVLGGSSNVGVTLPGTGIGLVDNTLGTATGAVNGLTGNGGTVNRIVGSLTGDGVPGGSGPVVIVNPDGSTGPGAPGTPGNRGFMAAGGGAYATALGASLTCAGQDPRAVAYLLRDRKYSPRLLASWRRAANVQVVPLKLCPPARSSVRTQLAGNGTVAMVQSLAAADPLISTSLSRTRYNASNVLAVDQANGTLTVYVF